MEMMKNVSSAACRPKKQSTMYPSYWNLSLIQLSDPTRLKIFWILCHMEECVINIAAIMDMSSPAISHHLRLLKACGLITSRRNGKEMYYKAADTEIVSELHYAIDKIAAITCPDWKQKTVPYIGSGFFNVE